MDTDRAGAGTIGIDLHHYEHHHYLNGQHLHHERRQPPEDTIAGRAGIFCAGALCMGVRGPWRVSLASGERSGQEDEESHLRGK